MPAVHPNIRPGLPSSTDEVLLQPNPRRVRGFVAGVPVVDSTRSIYVFEAGSFPMYYFPLDDVRQDLLEPSARRSASARRGAAVHWSITGPERREDAVWGHPEPPPGGPDLRGYVAFEWDRVDAWFEEDEEVFRHARSPYHRVDRLRSSRHVVVRVAGIDLADTRRPVLVFETGFRLRYYVPTGDVRLDLLVPSPTRTVSPYNGGASYWSLELPDRTVPDVAWGITAPTAESGALRDHLSFYEDRIDEIRVDGEAIDLSGGNADLRFRDTETTPRR